MAEGISKFIGKLLRAAELICAAVVLFIMSSFIYKHKDMPLANFNEGYLVATGAGGISIVVAFIFLFDDEFAARFFLLDVVLSVAWFAAFTLLLKAFSHEACDQDLKELSQITAGGACNSQRAAWGFAFLSGCVWLGGFVFGLWTLGRGKKERKKTDRIVRVEI